MTAVLRLGETVESNERASSQTFDIRHARAELWVQLQLSG
jgi:hypothetical protein